VRINLQTSSPGGFTSSGLTSVWHKRSDINPVGPLCRAVLTFCALMRHPRGIFVSRINFNRQTGDQPLVKQQELRELLQSDTLVFDD
jgi:hypothetical protein